MKRWIKEGGAKGEGWRREGAREGGWGDGEGGREKEGMKGGIVAGTMFLTGRSDDNNALE